MNKILLEIKDVNYKVGDKKILRGVNLKIRNDEIHSIVGVNGTGKTTLASMIMGISDYKPTSGRIIFDGKDITKFSVTERAKLGITLAWQFPANFEGITVGEYLSLKKGGVPPDKCLKLVGLNPDIYLQRTVDENLSGGERKRIELASAFSINPKLVILDEPDSGIDMASIDAIRNVIKNFKSNGTSVILITHNERIAKIGDIVSLMCSGEIVKEGTSDEVTKFFKKYCKGCNHIGKIDKEVLNEC